MTARRMIAGCTALLVALCMLGFGTAGVAGAATDPANAPGAQRLAACLESGRSLSALFLMDRSGSLDPPGGQGPGTDEGGLRYEGLRAGLQALTELADTGSLQVEAAVAAFDDSYYPSASVVDWTQLGGAEGEDVVTAMVDEATDQTRPRGGTDFVVAMDGAIQDMADRASQGNCQVVLWFTDGVNDSNNDNWETDLCAPGGIMDQVRASDITVVGLHLTQGVPEEYLDEFPAITLGQSGPKNCGTVPVPEGASPGIYLRAEDAQGLAGLFRSVVNIVEGCTPTGSLGTYVDPGIRKVRINIEAAGPVSSVRLDGPAGSSFVAPADGTGESNGYTTQARETNGFVSLLLTLPPGEGAGKWTVTPVGSSAAPEDIEFCVIPGLSLELDAATLDDVFAGGTSSLGLDVKTLEGGAADLSVYASAVPSATATGASGNAVPASATLTDPATGDVAVEVSPATSDARLQLAASLALTTQSGLALSPLAGEWGVPVNLSAEFPIVDPRDVLALSDAVHREPATGEMTLTGSTLGPTQVCLGDMVDVVQPDAADGSVIDYQTGCIDLGPAEQKTVQVQVVPAAAAVGAGSGYLPLELRAVAKPDGTQSTSAFDLPVQWRYTDPIDAGRFSVLAALVLLASILLPLLAIWLANWLAARFDVERLRWAGVDVSIIGSQLVRTEPLPARAYGTSDQDPELLDPSEFKYLSAGASRRSFTPGMWRRRVARKFSVATDQGVLAFRGVTPASPLRYPEFRIEAPAGTRILSNVGAAPLGDGSTAQATGGMGLQVVLCIADDVLRGDGDVVGTLVVLTRSVSTDPLDLEQQVMEAISWRGAIESLRSALPPADGGGVDKDTTGIDTGISPRWKQQDPGNDPGPSTSTWS